jgi:hypothetical protein
VWGIQFQHALSIADELLAEYQRVQPKQSFSTFAVVDWVWKERIEAVLPELKWMQRIWPWQDEIPPDSPWNINR